MAAYQGRFGKVSAVEFFKRDDWYDQMFLVHGGNCSGQFLGYGVRYAIGLRCRVVALGICTGT